MSEAFETRRPVDSFILDVYLGFTASCLAVTLAQLISNLRLSVLMMFLPLVAVAVWRAGDTAVQRLVGGFLLFAAEAVVPVVWIVHNGSRQTRGDGWLGIACAAASIVLGFALRLLPRRREDIRVPAVMLAASTACSLVLILGGPGWVDHVNHPLIDKAMPALTLQTMDGQPFDTGRWKGHIVVMSFWATWCGPCKEEMPVLSRLAKARATDPRLQFVVTNVGMGMSDTHEAVAHYLSSHPVPMTPLVFQGEQADFERLERAFDGNGIPLLFVLDARGHARWVDSGFSSDDRLTAQLNHVIDSLQAEMK